MKPTLLLYEIKPEKLSRLRLCALKLHIKTVSVPEKAYPLPVGALSETENIASLPEANAAPLGREMAVFCGFSDALLSTFLGAMRTGHDMKIALKAVLTEENAGWNSTELFQALTEEHEAMTGGKG